MNGKTGNGQTDWGTLFDQFSEHLKAKGKSLFTVRCYNSDLSLFSRWQRETYGQPENGSVLSGLNSIDLLDYVARLKQKSTGPTVNRKIASLRTFFAFLLENGLITKDHSAVLKPVRVELPKAPEVLSHAEYLRLLHAINQEGEKGKRDWAIIHLMVNAGLRIGEVANVRVGDIEISSRKGILLIRSGKGGQPRKVFLNSTARKAVQDYLGIRSEHSGDDHLFISQKRSPLSRREIHNVVKFYLERTGVPEQSAHSLRHLFATTLYNKTKDIMLVREALGHRSLNTTLRYARKTEAEIAEKIEESELNIFR